MGPHDNGWKVRVAAPAERGRANEALAELLAGVLGLAQREVRVVSGASSRHKLVEVEGITLHDAQKRLNAAARASD